MERVIKSLFNEGDVVRSKPGDPLPWKGVVEKVRWASSRRVYQYRCRPIESDDEYDTLMITGPSGTKCWFDEKEVMSASMAVGEIKTSVLAWLGNAVKASMTLSAMMDELEDAWREGWFPWDREWMDASAEAAQEASDTAGQEEADHDHKIEDSYTDHDVGFGDAEEGELPADENYDGESVAF